MSGPNYRYRKQYNADRVRGVPRGFIPAADVIGHLNLLVQHGATLRGIGDAAGVASTVVREVILGRHEGVQRKVAARLLACTIDKIRERPTGMLDMTGTRRRVQALHALGWRRADLKEIGGVDIHAFTRNPKYVTTRNYWVVRNLYDKLSMNLGPSAETRRRAAQWGFAPPLAWDDDDLDDKAAAPHPWRSTARGVDMDDVEMLARAGETWHGAAGRLGMLKDSLGTLLRRAERPDLTDLFHRNSEIENRRRNQWSA